MIQAHDVEEWHNKYFHRAFLITIVFILINLQQNTACAEQIVIVGDSHSCGDFGRQLVRNLSAKGQNNVVMYCAGGLSTQHWVNGFSPKKSDNKCRTYSSKNLQLQDCLGTGDLPSIEKILQFEPRPSRVVVALGTNNLAMNALSSFDTFSQKIKNAGIACHWVGPPTLGQNGRICREHGHNLDSLVKTLRSATKNTCEYVDSRPVTRADNTPDCIHRYGIPAHEWADAVARLLNPSALPSTHPPNSPGSRTTK
jgi:hypothetical protein